METIWQMKTLLSVVPFVAWSAVGSTVAGQSLTVDEFMETSETRYGAHVDSDDWVHFVVFAPDATHVDVLLYAEANAKTPKHEVAMKKNGSDWRVRVRKRALGMACRPAIRDMSEFDQVFGATGGPFEKRKRRSRRSAELTGWTI